MIRKDDRPSSRLCVFCVAFICSLQWITVDSQTIYRLGTDCGTTSTITEKSNTQIEFDGRYDGDKVTSGDLNYQQCDRIIFQTKNYDEPDARYNICISPIYFNDRECAVTLDFKNSLFASPLKSFDCQNRMDFKFCVPNGEKLYVFLNLSEGKSFALTTFLFRVVAERTDKPTPVLAIVLGVLGGVLLVVIAAIIFIVYRRRNKQRHLVT